MRSPMIKYCVLLLLVCPLSALAADIDDLTEIDTWQEVAHGIWKVELGDADKITRYTDFAADTPKLDRINQQFQQVPFPANLLERKIRFRITNDHKVVLHIPLQSDEQIYGFGLQFDRTGRNRQILELKVDHFEKGGGATHAPVPFFISSRGYGVFLNTARFLKVYCNIGNRKDSPNNPPTVDRNPPDDEPQPGPWLALPPGDAMEAYLHGEGLELVLFAAGGATTSSLLDASGDDDPSGKAVNPASLLDIVARYNLFSGGGAMPPLWGLGFWHRVPSKFSADQTNEEIAEFDRYKIPLDVIGLEPGWQTKSYPCTFEWQKKRFPDPEAFTQSLLKRGIRLNLWENPYVSPESKIYESLYPLSGSHLVWLGIVPDYTLPEAQRILTEQHQRDHVDIGISGYKIDEVDGYDRWLWPDHATFPSGVSAETMRQTYGMLMQQMIYRELFHKADQRTYGLVRASNGAASAYPFVIYSDSYGHQQYITGLSSASLSGILWCPEIRSAADGREWLNRMHTVCFSPLAMLNAWASGQKPWSFPEMTDKVRETIELRMRLLPYLYTAFAEYHHRGVPPVRSMLLEQDVAAAKLPDDQFMFGPSLLVAPFYEEHATQREVQLPAGKWYDFYSGKLAGEAETIRVTSDKLQNRVPLFVKEGAVIPLLARSVMTTDDAYGQPLEIRHYGRMAGSCLLYEDDGKTFAYEAGDFRLRKIDVDTNGNMTSSIPTDNSEAMFGPIESVRQMTAK